MKGSGEHTATLSGGHRPRKRATQYSEASMMESRSRSVLDTPLEPVIGLAEGETRWRSMTPQVKQRRRRHCEERSDEAIHSFFPRRDGLLRFARNDGWGNELRISPMSPAGPKTEMKPSNAR